MFIIIYINWLLYNSAGWALRKEDLKAQISLLIANYKGMTCVRPADFDLLNELQLTTMYLKCH